MNKFNLSLISGAFLFGSLVNSAAAVVIYNWHDVSSDPDVGPIRASIEFDENIWSLGESFVYDSSLFPGAGSGQPLLYFGVSSIIFETPLVTGYGPPTIYQGFSDPIELKQTTCGQSWRYGFGSDPVTYCAANGMSIDDPVVSQGYWKFDIQFGEFLTGSMYLNDLYTDVLMSSQGPLFTIDHIGSDSYGPCKGPSNCSGGTGYWRLDHSTMPVSEPSAAFLFATGLISLVAVQRRRASKQRSASA